MAEDVSFDPFLLAGNALRTVAVATRQEDYPPPSATATRSWRGSRWCSR